MRPPQSCRQSTLSLRPRVLRAQPAIDRKIGFVERRPRWQNGTGVRRGSEPGARERRASADRPYRPPGSSMAAAFMRRILPVALIIIVCAMGATGAETARASPYLSAPSRPLPALMQALVPKLRRMNLPVYLPSWLPSFEAQSGLRGRLLIAPDRRSYDLQMFTPEAAGGVCAPRTTCRKPSTFDLYLFEMMGRPGSLDGNGAGARRLVLPGRRIAYFYSTPPSGRPQLGGVLEWRYQGYTYWVSLNHSFPLATLIRVAQSVVPVR
jgi:hypothetical protein